MVEIHFRIQGVKELKSPKKITTEDKKLAVSILARGVDAFAQRLSFRFSVLWMAIKSLIKSGFGSLSIQDTWVTDHLPLPYNNYNIYSNNVDLREG